MIKDFYTFVNERKSTKEIEGKNVKEIHKLLDIPTDKCVDDVYKTGDSLAKALLKATDDQEKTAQLLVYSLNVLDKKEGKIFKDALSYLKNEVPNKGVSKEETEVEKDNRQEENRKKEGEKGKGTAESFDFEEPEGAYEPIEEEKDYNDNLDRDDKDKSEKSEHNDDLKLHNVLGMSTQEKIEDKYKTGESLAKALLKKTKTQEEAADLLDDAIDIVGKKEGKILLDAMEYLKKEVPNYESKEEESEEETNEKKRVNKWSKGVKIKRGKMHDLLNIPEDKDIHDKYTTGEDLAKALLRKVDKAKASHMLAFAANVNKKSDNIFSSALHWIKNNIDKED